MPSVMGVHVELVAFQRYAPPTSVRAYSRLALTGW